MRAVVTGGAGFIGSHLVDALVADGASVVVIDDLSTGTLANVNKTAEFRELDVLGVRPSDLAGADVVFHLAAQADVQTSMRTPLQNMLENAHGSATVLEAARIVGVPVVLASTGGAIYGECEFGPASEKQPPRPASPYAVSKLCAEQVALGYNCIWGTTNTVLRLGNVYGSRQRSTLEGGVVAIFLDRAARGEAAVIFGDGSQTRDFVHVSDVAAAFVAAVGVPGVFNIGTGRETTVAAVHAACGGGRPRFETARAGDLRRSVLDPSRALSRLGWSASMTVAEGIAALRSG